jgi:hypothetical protein
VSLQLLKSQIKSLDIRDVIQGGRDAREIVFDLQLPEDLRADDTEMSIWEKIGDWTMDALKTAGLVLGAAAAGFLIGGPVGAIIAGVAVLGAVLPWGTMINWVTEKIDAVFNFNWNVSDQDLKQQIEGYNNQIMGIWGEWFGRGLGYATSIAVGAGISLLVPVIGGKALAAFVAGGVLSEALEDMWDELRSAISQTFSLIGQGVVARAYMGTRSFLKWMVSGFDNETGEDAAAWRKWVVNKWGAAGEPEISFNTLRGKQVESIDDQGWRTFVDGAIDGHWDGFSRGMTIVGRQIDEAWRASFAAVQLGEGPDRGLRIQPDPENDREQFLFFGSQADVISDVQSTLHIRSMIQDRDIGTPGPLTPEGLEIPEFQGRRLTLFCYSVEKPPWRTEDGKRAKKVEINVPNPRRNLRWDEIKLALGGRTGYLWGPRYAVGRFESRRKMVVYADTEENAIARLNALALLSEDDIVTIQSGTRAFQRNETAATRRRTVRVFPAYLKSVVLRRTSDLTQPGRPDIEGQSWREQSQKIDLWRDQMPANGDEIFTWEVRPQP